MPDPDTQGTTTVQIENYLARWQQGDQEAWAALLAVACHRLQALARTMHKDFAGNLPHGTEVDDVVNEVVLKLPKMLEEIKPATAKDFFSLTAQRMRWLLLDWVRKQKPAALGEHDPADLSSADPKRLASWTEFHEKVEQLPSEEQEVFHLLFYQDLSRTEAAQVLDISLATLKRRWSQARRRLHDLMHGTVGSSRQSNA